MVGMGETRVAGAMRFPASSHPHTSTRSVTVKGSQFSQVQVPLKKVIVNTFERETIGRMQSLADSVA